MFSVTGIVGKMQIYILDSLGFNGFKGLEQW